MTDDFKIVTETSVTIKKYVRDCDGPVTILHNMKQFVTACDGSVTITDTFCFLILNFNVEASVKSLQIFTGSRFHTPTRLHTHKPAFTPTGRDGLCFAAGYLLRRRWVCVRPVSNLPASSPTTPASHPQPRLHTHRPGRSLLRGKWPSPATLGV